MEALAELKAYDALHHVCAECVDKCCRLVSCEFYEPNFPACTIHDFRPVICRLHFCHRFGSENKELIKALGDMFMSGLESAEKIDAIARFYDSPPLSPHAHKLVQQILPLFDAFREGEMDAASIIKISEKAAEQYRKGKP